MADQVINLVLVGRPGNGKSATGNTLLGEKQFISKRQAGGVTMKCKMHRASIRDGPILNVIDTPGLFDLAIYADDTRKEIINCFTMAEEGIHAVLLVLSVRLRTSQEDESILNELQDIFGSKVIEYMIVLFTGGDCLEEEDETLDEYLSSGCTEYLMVALRMCGDRKVLFDNKTTDKGKQDNQVQKLLALVATIKKNNDGKPFTAEMHRKLMEEAERRRKDRHEVEANKSMVKEMVEKRHKNSAPVLERSVTFSE